MGGQGWARSPSTRPCWSGSAYPLGLFMARVYSLEPGRGLLRWLAAGERRFCRLVRVDARREQDWRSYAKTVLVFSVLFSLTLYAIQRLQEHLFLNPDKLHGAPRTSRSTPRPASSPTRTGSTTAARPRCRTSPRWPGWRCRTSSPRQSGWRCSRPSCAGSRGDRAGARELLGRPVPLARLRPAAAGGLRRRDPDLAGSAADLRRARDRDHAPGRVADDRPRPGRVADRDQAARDERRRLLQLELGRAVREPQRALELPRGAVDPADPGGPGVHVREDGARPTARVDGVRGDVRHVRRRRRRRSPPSSTARRCCAPRA